VDFGAWSADPAVLLGVGVLAVLYVRGWLHMKRRQTSQLLYFSGGLGTIVVALCSPIGTYDQALFSLHMTEHLLLTLVAPPLLLLGKPLVPLLWGLPEQERRGVARLFAPRGALARMCGTLVRPVVALGLFSVTFALWHLPSLYEAAQGQTLTHYTEHATFFLTGMLFWWPVIHPHGGPRRLAKVAAIAYFALPMVEGTLMGALFTFASRPLYASYVLAPRVTTLSPLDDQQLAGLIMWIPGGLVYAVAVLTLLVSVLREEEARAELDANPPPVAGDDPVLLEHA
jgi:putative membrane protein